MILWALFWVAVGMMFTAAIDKDDSKPGAFIGFILFCIVCIIAITRYFTLNQL